MFSRLSAALVAAVLLSPAFVQAQSVSLPGEFQKKIKAATDVAALGSGQFGNATSDATGKTVFENVDISLPGNSALPVQFGRRLVIEPRYIAEELGGIGNWDVEVPYIDATISQSLGWSVASASSPNRYKRCSFATSPVVEGAIFRYPAGESESSFTLQFVQHLGVLLATSIGNPPAFNGRQKWSYAASASFCIGVMPPSAMFGRSWLYVQSQRVAES